jgi:hypothetical protein
MHSYREAVFLRIDTVRRTGANVRREWMVARTLHGGVTGYSSFTKVAMLVTLVAVLCNSQLCLEKVVTTSEQSGITMTACQVNAQIGIADWLANGPYREWKLQSYKCVMGKYIPKSSA